MLIKRPAWLPWLPGTAHIVEFRSHAHDNLTYRRSKGRMVPGVGHGYGYQVVRNTKGMFRYNSLGSFVKGGAYRTYDWVDPGKDLVEVSKMQLTNGGGDTAGETNRSMTLSGASIN